MLLHPGDKASLLRWPCLKAGSHWGWGVGGGDECWRWSLTQYEKHAMLVWSGEGSEEVCKNVGWMNQWGVCRQLRWEFSWASSRKSHFCGFLIYKKRTIHACCDGECVWDFTFFFPQSLFRLIILYWAHLLFYRMPYSHLVYLVLRWISCFLFYLVFSF